MQSGTSFFLCSPDRLSDFLQLLFRMSEHTDNETTLLVETNFRAPYAYRTRRVGWEHD